MQSDFLDLARVNHVINNYETEFSLFLSLSLSLSLSLCMSVYRFITITYKQLSCRGKRRQSVYHLR